MGTKKAIIQKVIAMLMVFMITIADFALLGNAAFTYAVDAIVTNNKNVTVLAYFEDEGGNRVQAIDQNIDSQNLKLKVDVTLSNDDGLGGYFDGKITLSNANFKFKEGDSIDVHVAAGNTTTVEKEVEYLETSSLTEGYLNTNSKVSLAGKYVNSKKQYDIEGTTEVTVNWVSNTDTLTKLSTQILTNTVYKVNEDNKRIVQLLLSSELENNSYPVKETQINITVPSQVESVQVHKRTINLTNQNSEFNENNYTYNKETGILTINVSNNKDLISWAKGSKDIFVVTYTYPQEINLANAEIKANSYIKLYDGKELSADSSLIVEKEIDGIVTADIIENENEIYKGKIYTGEERNYSSTTQINVDYATSINNIEIIENQPTFIAGDEQKNANIQYVQTIINKQEMLNIFGTDGYITIKNQDGSTVANINKDTETDESGNIVINYSAETTSLDIITTKPQTNGILNIRHNKKIMNSGYSREDVKKLTSIRENVRTVYVKNDNNTNSVDEINDIVLKDSESTANLQLDTTSLSTTNGRQVVKLRVVLETDDESKDLYKNPSIKITFPSQIKNVSAKYQVLYENGLAKDSATLVEKNGKTALIVNLKGEQTSYPADAINGTVIDVCAEVELDSLAVSSMEDIILNYTNENETIYSNNGVRTARIEIVSENSMILTNNAETSQVTTQGNEQDKELKLEVKNDAKTEKIVMEVINNEGASISDVTVLGKLPTVESKIELANAIGVDTNSTVYYTEVENPNTDLNNPSNGWTTEQKSDARHYLVAIEQMEEAQKVTLSYDLAIASNLDYNISAEENYQVSYTSVETGVNSSVESSTILLTTGSSAVLEETLITTVGGEELTDGAKVRSGEIIKYELKVKNSGTEDAQNVNFVGSIAEGTILVEANSTYNSDEQTGEDNVQESVIEETGDENVFVADPEIIVESKEINSSSTEESYYIEKAEREVKQENVTIPAGSTAVFTYMAKVSSDIKDGKEVTATATVSYKEEAKTKSIKHILSKATLSTTIVAAINNEILNSGSVYQYNATITNISDKEQKNIEVTINNNELITLEDTMYSLNGEYKKVEGNTFTIDSLGAGKSLYIEINAVINQVTGNSNSAIISVTAKDADNNIYRSNEIAQSVNAAKFNVNLETQTTSSNKTGYVSVGDKIVYTTTVKNDGTLDAEELTLINRFSDYLSVESVKLNGNDVKYNKMPQSEESYSDLEVQIPLKAGETAKVVITGIVDEINSEETIKILNKSLVYNNGAFMAETEENTYYLEATQVSVDKLQDSNGTEDNNNKDENGNVTYTISGTAWLDQNENGLRDSGETLLSGITVHALRANTSEIAMTTTTDNEGFYTLTNLTEGQYLVVFEYDTNKYMVTAYQVDTSSTSKNSDVIKSNISINGETKEVAVTDSINLNSSVANVNLGLVEAKVFDLDLNKYVSKIVVTNASGTTTYDQKDATTLAKVEIGSKYLSGSNVVVEYTIQVKNAGEVAGYAKSIVDYLPSELSFSSSLNSDWYQSGEYIYNKSLENTKIEPGETKELKVILTKAMTSSNTGLINNKAAIATSYNSLGVQDNDSDENGMADVIIGIKTGAAVSYIILTLTIVIVICGVAYLVNKKILKSKIKI